MLKKIIKEIILSNKQNIKIKVKNVFKNLFYFKKNIYIKNGLQQLIFIAIIKNTLFSAIKALNEFRRYLNILLQI